MWMAEKFCINPGKLSRKVSFLADSLKVPSLQPSVAHIIKRINAGKKKSTARPAEDFLETLDLVDIKKKFGCIKSN